MMQIVEKNRHAEKLKWKKNLSLRQENRKNIIEIIPIFINLINEGQIEENCKKHRLKNRMKDMHNCYLFQFV